MAAFATSVAALSAASVLLDTGYILSFVAVNNAIGSVAAGAARTRLRLGRHDCFQAVLAESVSKHGGHRQRHPHGKPREESETEQPLLKESKRPSRMP